AWIAVGWATQGAALWAFGLRIRSIPVRAMGATFLALAAGRLVFVDTLAGPPHDVFFVPFLNRYGSPAIWVVAALIGAAGLSYVFRPRRISLDFIAMRLWSLGGFLLLWMVLSIEVYDFFVVKNDFGWDFDRLMARTALSVVWALYAVVTLLA